MNRNLQKYYLKLIGFLLLTSVAYAQVDKSKSRLAIGKNPTTKTTAVRPMVQPYAFVKSMPKEVKLDKPSIVNQYFRNALLNGTPKPLAKPTTKPSNTKVANNEAVISEKSLISIPENSQIDRLFVSEKINVSNIYPNPVNDFATIDYVITGNVNSAKITISTVIGNEIESFELEKSERKLRIPTASLESGIYLYQLSVDGKKVTKKLFVQHN